MRDIKAVAAERVRRFVKGRPGLLRTSERFWRAVHSLPTPFGKMFESIFHTMLRETRWDEVLLVTHCLESQSVQFWLAGGWGVDALVGRQTRRHKDLDVVIEDFQNNEPRIRRALLAIGFDHIDIDTGGVWMPNRSSFEDDAGHRIELMDIDWEYLRSVFALHPEKCSKSTAAQSELAREVLTVGSIDGRAVPCLTTAAQLLFHTGFYLEPLGSADVSLLQFQPDVESLSTEPLKQ